MSFASTHKAIATLLASWNTADAILFADNQPENPPTTATWMRWSLQPSDTFSADATATFERTVGLLYFQIFTPEAKGTRVAHDLADKLSALLNEKRFLNEEGGHLRFERVRLQYVGAGGATGWLQHNAIVQYTEDDAAVNAPSVGGQMLLGTELSRQGPIVITAASQTPSTQAKRIHHIQIEISGDGYTAILYLPVINRLNADFCQVKMDFDDTPKLEIRN